MATESSKNVESTHVSECQNTVAAFKRDLAKLRSGRASPGLVEGITVEYYGAKTPLNQLAQISVPEPRMIMIQVYDSKAVTSVEKAIHASGLGFNPSAEGNSVRIIVPPLTEETRQDLKKHLHKMTEEYKISVRNHRRDANDVLKKLEKDSLLSKDDAKKAQDVIQKQTDKFIAEVDTLLSAKEAEIMEV